MNVPPNTNDEEIALETHGNAQVNSRGAELTFGEVLVDAVEEVIGFEDSGSLHERDALQALGLAQVQVRAQLCGGLVAQALVVAVGDNLLAGVQGQSTSGHQGALAVDFLKLAWQREIIYDR